MKITFCVRLFSSNGRSNVSVSCNVSRMFVKKKKKDTFNFWQLIKKEQSAFCIFPLLPEWFLKTMTHFPETTNRCGMYRSWGGVQVLHSSQQPVQCALKRLKKEIKNNMYTSRSCMVACDFEAREGPSPRSPRSCGRTHQLRNHRPEGRGLL